MKRPYFASRNHFRRCCFAGSSADLEACSTFAAEGAVRALRPAGIPVTIAEAATASTTAVCKLLYVIVCPFETSACYLLSFNGENQGTLAVKVAGFAGIASAVPTRHD